MVRRQRARMTLTSVAGLLRTNYAAIGVARRPVLLCRGCLINAGRPSGKAAFAVSCRITARMACGRSPFRSATPSRSLRPVTAMLRPLMITSLILYAPSCQVRRQSTLIGRTVRLQITSLETIAPSASRRLPVTLGAPPSAANSDYRSLYVYTT